MLWVVESEAAVEGTQLRCSQSGSCVAKYKKLIVLFRSPDNCVCMMGLIYCFYMLYYMLSAAEDYGNELYGMYYTLGWPC